MDGPRSDLAVVVLAAGAGSRFGPQPGAKLLAPVPDEPMLARILTAVRTFGPAATIVVLGHGADEVEQALDWHDEIRVRNHQPERGLSSSLQVGIDALRALPDDFDGAFIVLGDQPRLRSGVMATLAAAASTEVRPADRAAIVPEYPTDEARNPVLLLRQAWSWADELEGDHGLGRLISARPDQVLSVPVDGEMPDVDTPHDLEHLLR